MGGAASIPAGTVYSSTQPGPTAVSTSMGSEGARRVDKGVEADLYAATTLLRLPEELWAVLLLHLPSSSAFALAVTCQQACSTVYATLRQCTVGKWDSAAVQQLCRLTVLRDLHIYNPDGERDCLALLPDLPLLQSLHIQLGMSVPMRPASLRVLSRLPQLHRLTLQSAHLSYSLIDAVARSESLRELVFDDCSPLDEEGKLRLADCSSLTALLGLNFAAEDCECFMATVGAWPALQQLSFTVDEDLPEGVLSLLADGCPRLQLLRMEAESMELCDGLHDIARLSCLQELALSNVLFEEEVVASVAELAALTSLRTVSLTECSLHAHVLPLLIDVLAALPLRCIALPFCREDGRAALSPASVVKFAAMCVHHATLQSVELNGMELREEDGEEAELAAAAALVDAVLASSLACWQLHLSSSQLHHFLALWQERAGGAAAQLHRLSFSPTDSLPDREDAVASLLRCLHSCKRAICVRLCLSDLKADRLRQLAAAVQARPLLPTRLLSTGVLDCYGDLDLPALRLCGWLV
eukprot:PLAT7499.1.p1 GENE.PLAT7499.1~~PLAT7499.1.p1  ORF type:complete len:537 (-),score=142.71 PLAT7499.1:126-1706(-)